MFVFVCLFVCLIVCLFSLLATRVFLSIEELENVQSELKMKKVECEREKIMKIEAVNKLKCIMNGNDHGS